MPSIIHYSYIHTLFVHQYIYKSNEITIITGWKPRFDACYVWIIYESGCLLKQQLIPILFQFNSQTHLHINSVNRSKSFNTGPLKSNTIGGLPNSGPSGQDPATLLKENVNNNSNKIAAALHQNNNNNNAKIMNSKDKRRKDRNSNDSDDDGGFDAPNRPYVRGLSRKASTTTTATVSAVPTRDGSRPRTDLRDNRQYRSYRHSRNRRQQTSHVWNFYSITKSNRILSEFFFHDFT